MFLVTLICSGQTCEEFAELAVENLDELAGLGCECGYGRIVLTVEEVEEPRPARVVRLDERDDLPRAA